MMKYMIRLDANIPAMTSLRAALSSSAVAPRRCARLRPLARSSSTSCAACQKNRYGEMVVPRMATSTEKNPRDHSTCGTIVACSARLQSTRARSEEHTSELQSHSDLVCRLLLE